eukprot:gene3633-4162_t
MIQNQKVDGLPSKQLDDELFTIDYSDLVIDRKNEIGRGSFGQVIKADYFGCEVAIKQLSPLVVSDPDYHKFMQREIRILSGMRHPNIVQYIGACLHEGKHMIVTEFVNGGDLHQFLKVNQNVTWHTKIRLASDIASAFSYLHSKQIIFRDLKPKNILIVEQGGAGPRGKLCDFGFARILDQNHRMLGDKQQGYLTICGSETTMAPEVFVASNYDEYCDVFSFGIVLYELMCGSRVVKNELKRTAENAFDLDLDRAESFVPASCPREFMELARWCCQYDPKKRPNFKQAIVPGLLGLLSKPIEQLTPRGGSSPATSSVASSNSPRTDSCSTIGSDGGSNNGSTDSAQNITGSVIYTGSVNNSYIRVNTEGTDYNSIVLNDDKTPTIRDSSDSGEKKHKITNPSFFNPPPSSASLSVSEEEEEDSPPSALLTSLSVSEIRYREPSIFEDPDKIIQDKKRFMSSPNLTEGLVIDQDNTVIHHVYSASTNNLSKSVGANQNSNKKKNKKYKKKKRK